MKFVKRLQFWLVKHRKLFLIAAVVAAGVLIGAKKVSADMWSLNPLAMAGVEISWEQIAVTVVGSIVKWYVQAIGKLVVVLIGILIKIAQYNNFVDSRAVENGWVIVRDVVNMFFILILLVIAFATIFNVKEYKYQAMLPRLLIMAVVINFSRTICGILIDFGQVVMLTFVNGFQAAAGGNFVNALKIDALLAFSPTIDPQGTSLGYVFAAFILAALVITVTLVVVVVMLMMLVMRIVALWFLVILSPIAFLTSVWPSGRLKQNYAKWWDMFLDNIMVGPLLAFFLWLSLLVLGQGTINTEVTPHSETEFETQLSASATKIGTFDNLVSYLMGIGMLLGSLAMAQGMRSAGAGIAGAALGKMKGYATAGVRGVAMAPLKGAKFVGKKAAGAVYEKSGARATVDAMKTTIQSSKFGKVMGLGTKEYKDMEKAKRDEKALRAFGQTSKADALRTQIVSAEQKKIEESGMTSETIKTKLDDAKKGSFEHEALARAAASKGIIKNDADFKKYAGEDRRMEEALRTISFGKGNKKAWRGWAADPKKQVNAQKEAEDNYYKMSRGERQAAYSNIAKGAEPDENGKATDQFAAVDLSVIDPEDFANFSEKIQKGILDAIVLTKENDPDKFNELNLSAQFDKLAAKVAPTSTVMPASTLTGPGGAFSAYSAANSKVLLDNQAKSVAEKRLNAYRAGTYQPSDMSKAAVQTFKNVVGQQGAAGRQWQQNAVESTYNIQNDISVMATAGDMAGVEDKIDKMIENLLLKAQDMDDAGVKTGQIDSATGQEMSNVDVFMNSDLKKNLLSASSLAGTRSANAADPVDAKTKEAMAQLANLVARSMEPVAPRTATMSNQAVTRKAVGRYTTSMGGARRAFDTAKQETDMKKRLKAVQMAIKKAKDTTSTITKDKKQFSDATLSEVDAINAEIEALSQLGASASNDDLNDMMKRLEELQKRIA